MADSYGSQVRAAKIAAMATVAAALIGLVAVILPKVIGGDDNKASGGSTNVPSIAIPSGLGPGQASVFLSANSGPGGSTVKVSGTGFAPNEEVVIRFHTDEVGSTTANGEGKFDNVAIVVPTSYSQFAPQQFFISASGRESLRTDQAPFTITG